MQTRYVITFDLKTGDEYAKAHQLLEAWGFEREGLPQSTAVGNYHPRGNEAGIFPASASQVGEHIKKAFRDAGLTPTHLYVALLQGPASLEYKWVEEKKS